VGRLVDAVHLDNLHAALLTHRVRIETWDEMETQLVSVTAFDPPAPPKADAVHNFPIRREAPGDVRRLACVAFLRRVERCERMLRDPQQGKPKTPPKPLTLNPKSQKP